MNSSGAGPAAVREYMPWPLADVARVSLAYGTNLSRLQATDKDLLQILDVYTWFDDAFP